MEQWKQGKLDTWKMGAIEKMENLQKWNIEHAKMEKLTPPIIINGYLVGVRRYVKVVVLTE